MACSTRSGPAPLTRYPLAPSRSAVERVVEVLRHRQHHDPHFGVVLGEPSVDLETGGIGQADVEQQHLGRSRLDECGDLVGALGLTDELDAIHLLDRRGQTPAGTSGGRRRLRREAVVDWSVTAASPECERGCGCRVDRARVT